jgi:hypothetical protein
MYPHERSLVKQLAGKPFAIIGVNSDSDLEELKKTIEEENITWRSFQNAAGVDGSISDNWGIRGWPTIYILDEKGTIRFSGHGGDIDKVITELLGEMGHEVSIVHEKEGDAESAEMEKSGDDDDDDDDDEDGKSKGDTKKDVKDKEDKKEKDGGANR